MCGYMPVSLLQVLMRLMIDYMAPIIAGNAVISAVCADDAYCGRGACNACDRGPYALLGAHLVQLICAHSCLQWSHLSAISPATSAA